MKPDEKIYHAAVAKARVAPEEVLLRTIVKRTSMRLGVWVFRPSGFSRKSSSSGK
jgi:hypothetical protein